MANLLRVLASHRPRAKAPFNKLVPRQVRVSRTAKFQAILRKHKYVLERPRKGRARRTHERPPGRPRATSVLLPYDYRHWHPPDSDHHLYVVRMGRYPAILPVTYVYAATPTAPRLAVNHREYGLHIAHVLRMTYRVAVHVVGEPVVLVVAQVYVVRRRCNRQVYHPVFHP